MICLFEVSTPLQFLIAILLSRQEQNAKKVLLISDAILFDPLRIQQRVMALGIFDKCHVMKERSTREEIIQQIHELSLLQADRLYFSSYSSVFSCYLYNQFVQLKKEIFLFEEGAATYNLYEKYEEFKRYLRDDCEQINLDYLSKIYVLDKRLYMSKNFIKVENIQGIDLLLERDFVQDLNTIYGYEFSEIQEKNIFFSQNFLGYDMSQKKYIETFFRHIHRVYGDNIVIKLHPFDSPRIYNDIGLKVMYGQIPWELIVINHIIHRKFQDKVLLSVSSTSLLYTFLLFNNFMQQQNTQYTLMFELFESPFNDIAKKFYKKVARVIKMPFNIPKSFHQLDFN